MKHEPRKHLFAFVAASLLLLGASFAQAQTTANGPYYADPSWDQKLQCDTQATCPRFVVLANWNNEAVLDRETGLVWQRTMGGAFGGSPKNYDDSAGLCSESPTGGRQGWRLPSPHELQSLIDPSVPFPNLALPAGHPFLGVPLGGAAESTGLWTGTTRATDPTQAYALDLVATGGASPTPKTAQQRFWCVRGGGPVSVY
jgi:uncharacterized protein DUF1566